MPSTANAASSSVNGPMAASVSNVMDSESRGKLVKANRPAAAIIRQTQTLLPLAFLFLLASSLLFWPINGAAVTNSRDSEINSVRHELAVYDNEIINEPEITCGPGVVHFVVKTKKGNASAVYVRGQSQNADCTFHDTRNVTIELAKCNVRRKREINPNPGIAYQMTLVVQLHPLFVTKVDRAYNVNCFYREKPQDVSVDFGVSDMVTQQLYSEPQLPACTYSVHRDSLNGPRVKYTHVGEQLWHVWECPSRMYSMLLYNCQAIDGKGAEYAIVDSNGCSKDEFLMPQISYSKDLTKAMAASAAFNFPDRNTMSFTCKIKLCMNSDSECRNITPPNCNGKRAKPGIPAGNFNEDTSGEQSLNSTETSPTWSSSTRGGSSSSTPQSSVNRSGSSTVVWAPSSTAGQARKEVSGEVIADIEGEQEGSTEAGSTTRTSQSSSSSTSSTTTSPTTETASATTSSSSSQTTPTSPTTTTATTTRASTESSSSSSTTEAPKRTTTEEELLSSQERMSSSSAEHPAPEGTASAASSGSSSTLTDGQRGEAPTQEALVLRTSSELPADFPRPDLLLQKDQALLAPPMKKGAQAAVAAASRMERLEKLDESVDKADANWVIGAEEEEATERSRPHRVPEWEAEEEEAATTNDEGGYRGSTKPVQIFDKRGENGGKSARAQRDTTRGPMEEEVVKKAQVIRRKAGGAEGTGVGGGGHGRRMVDFDISSPELMILDDYEPAAAAQRASSAGAQRSSVQEAPFIDWSSTDGRRGGAGGGGPSGAAGSANGICLSPIALICAGALLLLLLLVVAVVLIRATRKSAGTMMEHSFYSH